MKRRCRPLVEPVETGDPDELDQRAGSISPRLLDNISRSEDAALFHVKRRRLVDLRHAVVRTGEDM